MVRDDRGNGSNGTRRPIERLAAISVPVLLGALGIGLWSMLSSVVEGVRANQTAIIELRGAVEALTATVTERAADRWTAAQEAQQQVFQALVDTAQNEQLIDARAELKEHQLQLQAMAIELAIGDRRLDALEAMLVTFE